MKGFLYGQTEYNIKKSILKLDDYINKAKELGFDYLTITDSNMHAAYKFYTKCNQVGIKPVMGLEFEYTSDLKTSKVIFYAKNNNGYKNLLKITSLVKNDDEKNKAFNTLDSIKDYMSDLYKIFIFDNSLIEYYYVSGDFDNLNIELDNIKKLDGIIGVSLTNRVSKYNDSKAFTVYMDSIGFRYVPVHNARCLDDSEYIVLNTLSKIDGLDEEISPLDDFSFLKNPQEDSILDEMINGISLNLYNEEISLPKFPNTKNAKSGEYLYALCNKGLEKRGKLYQNYKSRLDYELSVIDKMGYNDYFLIVWDFIRYSKQNDILVGPGRGSAAGSLVAYTLGITDVDPLEYGLIFERFLNPERVTMPDIDTDFPDVKRDEIITYVKNLYGKDHVCSINAFATFGVKSSAMDVSKVLGIPKERVTHLVETIESLTEKGKDPFEIMMNEYKNSDQTIYDFIYILKKLDGIPRNITTHAAGVILSDIDLVSMVPLSKGLNDIYLSQFEASDLEAIGLLKMDFLGISNLTIIADTMKLIPGFDMKALRNIPLNDPKVYQMLSSGDTLGVFQLESRGIRRVLMNLKPTCFDDLVAVLALYRPGPMDNIPEFIERKHGKRFNYIHKDLEPILKSTYGIIVYQEQIMQIAQVFAGFSLGEADLLRRAVSKKKADKLESLQNDFVNRSVKRGYDQKTAIDVYSLILKFANYGFNKSHTVAYGIFAYQMAWLKVNYFREFMSNIANTSIGNANKTVEYIKYAKSHGLKVHKPNIYISTNKYVFNSEGLFMPLTCIKSLGMTAVKICEERDKGVFKGYDDFKERCSFVNKAQLEALIFSGALDMFGKTKKSMTENSSKEDELFFKHMDKMESQDEFDFGYLEKMERQNLGFNITYDMFSGTEEIKIKNRVTPIDNLVFDKMSTILCAFRLLNQITTKSGETMLSGSLDDENSSVRFVIFPKSYQAIGKIEKDCLYLASGFLKPDDRDKNNPPSFSIISVTKL